MTLATSIALATFDAGPHLDAQLESFVAQSRPPDELVVCDDGSRDDTRERLAAFAERAPFPVRVEHNPRRLGTTGNFERVVSLCTGDVLFLADQDDVWSPDKLAAHLEVYTRRPEVQLCFSDGTVVDAEGRELGYHLWDSLWFGSAERERVRAGDAVGIFLKHVVAAGTTLSFRSRYRDWLLPFPALRSCHDAWIAFLLACVGEVALLERDLMRYRLHGTNQIGLERPGLREQLARARAQLAPDPESGVPNAFAYAERFFEAARERLAAAGAPTLRDPASTLPRIDAKIAHVRRRADMPGGLLARIPAIASEALAGHYWRYSYGLKSLGQDLWLR